MKIRLTMLLINQDWLHGNMVNNRERKIETLFRQEFRIALLVSMTV